MPAKAKNLSKDKIVEVSLELAIELGWEHVRLSDIAERADISLSDLRLIIEDKFDILAAFGRMIDAKTLNALDEFSPEMEAREKLFDIMIERFEVLNEYREGLLSILYSFQYDPKQVLISSPHLCRSMSWMLEAAGIDTSGMRGALKVAGLSGLYLKVLKSWMKDETPDLSKTMAALDKELGRAEQVANTLGF